MWAFRRILPGALFVVVLINPLMGIEDPLSGNDDSVREEMYWQMFQQRLRLSERVHFDVQWHHRWISGGDQQWVAPRIRAHYHFTPQFFGSVGFVHFGQTNIKQVLEDRQQALSEYRFQQEIDHVHHTGPHNLFQRFVVEERFVHTRSFASKERSHYAYLRFRYRLGFRYNIGDFHQLHFSARVHNEVMFNAAHRLTKRAFDQNRIFAGVAVNFNRQLTTEIGYMNWYQQHISDVGNTRRNIIYIGVTHSFDLKNKQ